ncbi:MAG: hypothetical protein IJB52_10360 [Clostridia bacterium]|nr:hypothetical protein [Clostridia bacterium]
MYRKEKSIGTQQHSTIYKPPHQAEPGVKSRQKVTTMTNQEIFEMLADLEERLFYAYCADRENDALKSAHESARKALEEFARKTGTHN